MNKNLTETEIKNAAVQSGEHFFNGLFCAESVLLAIADVYGIKSEFIPRIATGHCAGIARTSKVCGAISGAIMAIGLKYGRNSGDDSVDESYSRVQKLMVRFEQQFGSTNCRDLTGCDLLTDEGVRSFYDNNKQDFCRELTENATRLALQLMQE